MYENFLDGIAPISNKELKLKISSITSTIE
jgi:hypothetical protein